MSRRSREWGGPAWTMPIPTKPRIHGNFAHFPPYQWLLCDVIQHGKGVASMLRMRVHNDPTWAEAERYFGVDFGGQA